MLTGAGPRTLTGGNPHGTVQGLRGCSSAGRARGWQSRGQGFDPPQLHHWTRGVTGPPVAPFVLSAEQCSPHSHPDRPRRRGGGARAGNERSRAGSIGPPTARGPQRSPPLRRSPAVAAGPIPAGTAGRVASADQRAKSFPCADSVDAGLGRSLREPRRGHEGGLPNARDHRAASQWRGTDWQGSGGGFCPGLEARPWKAAHSFLA